MNIQERIAIIVKLGNYIKADEEAWQIAKEQAYQKNGWFIPDFTTKAANAIADNFLQKDALEKWVAHYHLDDNITPKNVGIVMAGNIPLVGFQDMLAVFISGHHATIKLSIKDDVLLKHLVQYLYQEEVQIQNYISFADMLKGCDAYIATGGNNAAKSFEEYFGKYPSVIRKNKTSVAILTGNETEAELEALSNDIHLYFGLGCRNVTKLYVPIGYDFVPLLHSFKAYKFFGDHHKYKNNYDYQLSIILLNNIYYMTNESTMLIENKNIFSPISQVNYEYYENEETVQKALALNEEIQCIVSNKNIAFGQAQNPDLFTYADGIDTMEFLLTL
jgi:hypothetical protein